MNTTITKRVRIREARSARDLAIRVNVRCDRCRACYPLTPGATRDQGGVPVRRCPTCTAERDARRAARIFAA